MLYVQLILKVVSTLHYTYYIYIQYTITVHHVLLEGSYDIF